MAGNSHAARALHFMRQCRQLNLNRTPVTLVTRPASTDATPYSPSSFNRPLRSPLDTPPPSVDSNLDHLPKPPPPEARPPSERPVQLPSFVRTRAKKAPVPPAHAKFTFTNWVRNILGFETKYPTKAPPSIHVRNNPYRTKKSWPPDFRTLHPKQQFHFEKTFRRRALLKWARPNWHTWIKRLQRSMLLTACIYFVFIAEPDGGTPFDGFRVWFFGKLKNFGLSEENAVAAREYEDQAKAERDRRLAEKRRKEEENPLASGG